MPVVLLGYDHRGLKDFTSSHDTTIIDRTFLWQGDARILLAIVKYIEDKLNVAHDVAAVGVQVIILIEDSVRYYSSFLPEIYSEILQQCQRLISEGVNLSHKIMRMRARPKILLCSNYEDAVVAFSKYQNELLGVISDVEFPRGGKRNAASGADFARLVREKVPDVPVILQSSNPDNEARATKCGAEFLLKGSPLLLHDLRAIMLESFGFGDFVFRMPDRTEVDRAEDLRALELKLKAVPARSASLFHAERNHFSRWLKARTEFGLAEELRPQNGSADFAGVDELRREYLSFHRRLPRRADARSGRGFRSRELQPVGRLPSDRWRISRGQGARPGVRSTPHRGRAAATSLRGCPRTRSCGGRAGDGCLR